MSGTSDAAWWIGLLYVTAGLLGTVAALIPPIDARPVPVTVGAAAFGVVLVRRRRPLPHRAVSVLIAGASTLVTVGVWLDHDPTISTATAILYYWIAWCASVYCGRREVRLQIAFAAAGFLLLAWRTGVDQLPAVTLFVVAGMAGWVTANRYLLRGLERSNRRFASLVESLHEGLLVHDAAGNVVDVNPAAVATLGIARERLIGVRPSDVLTMVDADERPIPSDELPIAVVAATNAPVLHQALGLARGGQIQWLDVSVAPRVDEPGFVTIFHDTTQARAATRLLAESEARFRSLAERAPIGIFTADRSGEIDFANEAFSRISGLAPGRALRVGWADALGEDATRRLRRSFREVFARSRTGSVEVEISDGADATRHVQIDASVLLGVDGVERFVGTVTDVTHRHDLEERLRREATHDPLTGVANRLLFAERLGHALQRRERAGGLVAILVVDLDRFKPVNDTFGHRTGDLLLMEVAHRLLSSVRLADTVARLGGDEFVVLLDSPVTAAEVDVIAQRILRLLGAPFVVGDASIEIGASIGTAALGATEVEPIDPDEVISLADAALYEAKARGGGTVVHATRGGSDWRAAERADLTDPAPLEGAVVGAAAFEAANLPMLVIDPVDGRILSANHAASTFYGWSSEELCSRRISDINTLSPEDVRAEMDRAASSARHFFEFRHRLADGSICDVDVFSGPTRVRNRNVLVSTVIDATARRRDTTRAARSLSAARLLLDHDRDASFLVDANGIVLDASLGALEVLGIERNAILGSSWCEALAPAQQDAAMNLIERALARLDRVPVRRQLTTLSGRAVDVAASTVDEASRLLICTLTPMRTIDPPSAAGDRPARFDRFCLDAAGDGHPISLFAVQVGCLAKIREQLGSDSAEHVRERIVRTIAADLRLDGIVHVAPDRADELLVAVRGLHGVGGSRSTGDRLVRLIRDCVSPAMVDEADCGVRVGVSLVHDLDVGCAIDRARTALESADPRRDPVAVNTLVSRDRSTGDASRVTDLRGALDRDEFVLHYQPIVALPTRSVVGYEALIRWQLHDGPLLAPIEFLPLAESSGLITAIDDWVLLTATRAVAAMQADGIDVHVAVNISAHGLRSDRLVARVADVVRATALPPGALVIELTESAVLNHHHWHPRAIDDLHHLGVRVAIDDFGTGYSTLANLEHIRPDIVKIDRRFTASLCRSDQRTIAAAIAGFAHQLGHDVVVEGVETEEQHAIVTELGCRYGQGYLYGRPAPLPTAVPVATVERTD